MYYHNPNCSKSRAALDLLKQKGILTEIRLYLENSPSTGEITQLIEKLGIPVRELVRRGEPEYTALQLDNASDQELIEAMAKHPNLIERPILVHGDKAVIGRPPERVLELLN